MPKLYFRYGAMNSSKTANLLMVFHNYESQKQNVILIKPKIDNRFSEDIVASRCGLSKKATLSIDKDYNILDYFKSNNELSNSANIYLIDEAHFLSKEQIDQLRIISTFVPVIAYGLRTDYKTNLFEGSKRLMELSDSIEEIKTICSFCSKKAIINMKHCNGIPIKEGNDEPDIGFENKYNAVCWNCYNK